MAKVNHSWRNNFLRSISNHGIYLYTQGTKYKLADCSIIKGFGAPSDDTNVFLIDWKNIEPGSLKIEDEQLEEEFIEGAQNLPFDEILIELIDFNADTEPKCHLIRNFYYFFKEEAEENKDKIFINLFYFTYVNNFCKVYLDAVMYQFILDKNDPTSMGLSISLMEGVSDKAPIIIRGNKYLVSEALDCGISINDVFQALIFEHVEDKDVFNLPEINCAIRAVVDINRRLKQPNAQIIKVRTAKKTVLPPKAKKKLGGLEQYNDYIVIDSPTSIYINEFISHEPVKDHTGTPKRPHARRGFYRHCKSGKTVFVSPTVVNGARKKKGRIYI